MRDVVWRLGFSTIALMALIILGPNVSCGLSNRLTERVTGQTPQAQIAEFLAAIADGDREAATNLWSAQGSPDIDLLARRQAALDGLLAYGPSLKYRILEIEWWRTCCEPGIIADPREAGGARVEVAIYGGNQPETIYVFHVLVPGGYWGSAMGNPVRHWAIVDVYPKGEAPLTWPWR